MCLAVAGRDDNLDHSSQVSQPFCIRSGDDERVVGQVQEAETHQAPEDVPADVGQSIAPQVQPSQTGIYLQYFRVYIQRDGGNVEEYIKCLKKEKKKPPSA